MTKDRVYVTPNILHELECPNGRLTMNFNDMRFSAKYQPAKGPTQYHSKVFGQQWGRQMSAKQALQDAIVFKGDVWCRDLT